MKIITKLYFSLILLFCVVLGSLVILIGPIQGISDSLRSIERKNFYHSQLKKLESETLRLLLLSCRVGTERDFSEENLVALRLGDIKIGNILNSLKDKTDFIDILSLGNRILISVQQDVLGKLYQGDPLDIVIINKLIDEDMRDLNSHINQYVNILNKLLDDQNMRLNILISRFWKFYIPLIVVTLFMGFWLILILQRSSLLSLKKTEKLFELISTGEEGLKSRLPVKGNDEITALCSAFNKFMEINESRFAMILDQSIIHELESNKLTIAIEEANDLVHSLESLVQTSDNRLTDLNNIFTSTLSGAQSIGESSGDLGKSISNIHIGMEDLKEGLLSFFDDQIIIAESYHKEGEILEILCRNIISSRDTLGQMVREIDGLEETISLVSKIMEHFISQAGRMDVVAINAAINASRAGDESKGFAVIAREFKNLALSLKDESRAIQKKLYEVNLALKGITENSSQFITIQGDNLKHTNGLISFIKEQKERVTHVNHLHHQIKEDWGNFSNGIEEVQKESEITLGVSSEILREMEKTKHSFQKQSETFSFMNRNILKSKNAFEDIYSANQIVQLGFSELIIKIDEFVK